MNFFTFLAILGGVSAVLSFILGSRAMAQYGDQCGRACWAWRSAFMFFVFLTILTAPLA